MKKSLAIILSLILTISCFSFNTFALNNDIELDMGEDDGVVESLNDIYVSANGNDTNAGTNSAPLATLSKATNLVASGGTIHIIGTVTIPAGMTWAKNRTDIAPVTITGSTLDGVSTNATFISIGYGIIFENITLNLNEGTNIYANGHNVTFGSNVTMPNKVNLFGGSAKSIIPTIEATNLTVLGGSFAQIYGGSNLGTITGNVNIYVGGNVNANCDTSSHDATYTVHGGGYNDTIGGNVNLTFTDNAKANYVYGGAHGTSSTIAGTINTTILGGSTMSVYGGFRTGTHQADVNLVIKGGNIAQVFGASGGTHTGDIDILVDGGTITRRIYGGCYNDYKITGWATSYYVNGKIDLVITANANITFTSTDEDRSIYAHSRQKTLSSTEDTSVIFANQAAYDKYYIKLKAQDSNMKSIMNGVSAADNIHLHGIIADDTADTITEGCTIKEGTESTPCASSTATLNLSSDTFVYTGEKITPANVDITGSFSIGTPSVTYDNNIEPGEATVVMSYEGLSVSKTFTILPDKLLWPGDTDNNGNVNLKDLITLARYVAGWENTDAYVPALDINGDNTISLNDVTVLANYLAGWDVKISTAPYLG